MLEIMLIGHSKLSPLKSFQNMVKKLLQIFVFL
jgi:hypothetical protein